VINGGLLAANAGALAVYLGSTESMGLGLGMLGTTAGLSSVVKF
jgi:hypothetical protein